MRKTKPIPEFASLTPEQRTQLYSWFEKGLTYDQLCDKLAQPPPEGFGIHVSRTKVYRYYHQWERIREMNSEDNSITVEAYQSVLNGDPVQLKAESLQRIKAHAFLITHQEQTDPATLLNLLKIFDFERSREYAERMLELRERAALRSERRRALAA